MKSLFMTLFIAFVALSFNSRSAQAEDPAKYILEGLASYDVVKNQIKLMTKKVEKTTGLSKKTIAHISGTMTQIAQKKISTKLLSLSTNVNKVSIRPNFEYSFDTKEAVATVGVDFSF